MEETEIQIKGGKTPSQDSILTPEAMQFIAKLHRKFNDERKKLLKARTDYQSLLRRTQIPELPPETFEIRKDPSWRVSEPPNDLKKRWVEITGPTDKKMVINALNSGANCFMADFEDATSPTWSNLIEGQQNLKLAVRRAIDFTSEEGKAYKLNEKIATLIVRPRGWHLPEKHFIVDGEEVSGSLFDFGLYFFHNAKELINRGSGPYFYLPKMEHYKEAALWNSVFVWAQDELKIPVGTVKVTVLIETILAAFQMEEIMYELKEHLVGLNAGRWDYIFSVIKKIGFHPNVLLPDRSQITMAVPFMKSYANLLVYLTHKRRAYAMGGMAAFIPSRKDPEINKIAFAKVFEDKEREVSQGFDGTWVAHPDLVQIAREPFQNRMQERSNQIGFPLQSAQITKFDLLNFEVPGGKITEHGIRSNINITLRYMSAWFAGVGAVGIHNLMEDAATAEISRAQLWQWLILPGGLIEEKAKFTRELFEKYLKEEYAHVLNDPAFPEAYKKNLQNSKSLLDRLVNDFYMPDFLTLPAYEMLG